MWISTSQEVKGPSHAQSKSLIFRPPGHSRPRSAWRPWADFIARSSSGGASCTESISRRVVLHLQWSSWVAARRDHGPHRAEQRSGAGQRHVMATVTVQVSACRRAALEWLMQRGQLGSGAAHEQRDGGGWKGCGSRPVHAPHRGRCKGRAWYAPVTGCVARSVEGWLVLCVGTRALQWNRV